MEFQMARREVYLRVSAILTLVLTACLIAFDTQTKVILFSIEKKATYKDIVVLKILVYITSAAAGYNILQLCKNYSLSTPSGGNFKGYYMYMAWITFLLDQMAVYLTFGANTAAFEAALFALTGSEAFQWMKVCNKFTRFCHLIAGGLLSGFVASLLMAIISTISAYNVFRMYSPRGSCV